MVCVTSQSAKKEKRDYKHLRMKYCKKCKLYEMELSKTTLSFLAPPSPFHKKVCFNSNQICLLLIRSFLDCFFYSACLHLHLHSSCLRTNKKTEFDQSFDFIARRISLIYPNCVFFCAIQFQSVALFCLRRSPFLGWRACSRGCKNCYGK